MGLFFKNFIKLYKESLRDLTPIILVVLFFQLFIIKSVPENWKDTAIGLSIVSIGLSIFLMGLQYGIFPIGERLTNSFSNKKNLILLIIFGFFVGFSTSIAEPALFVIAEKAHIISNGMLDTFILRLIIAISVGSALSIGIISILKGFQIYKLIIIGYIIVLSLTYFTPVEIIGLAYDLGGVTTSTITVPLVVAIGIGVAAIAKNKNPTIDGFGLIACAALVPMFSVQLYGIYVYNFMGDSANIIEIVKEINNNTGNNLLNGLVNTIKGIIPILSTILFFQYIVLREKIPKDELKNIGLGFLMVIFGLYAFIMGLDMGLFGLGENMALELTQLDNYIMIYLFAFSIGFSTTMAEPTLIAIANKASDISHSRINAFILRIFVALGVGIGITIGAYRIIYGDLIHYYIIIGYIIVIILTLFAPKHIISIAYDSGGVTTSTITVPLVAALGLGLATNIPGRNPMIDGFGLIAFASLFPIISVLTYGIISKYIKISIRYRYKELLEHDIPEIETKENLFKRVFKK